MANQQILQFQIIWDLIAKVDADDYVSKNFISDFVSKIKMNDKANYICTDIICFNEAKKIKFKIKQNFTTKNTFQISFRKRVSIQKKIMENC